MSFVNLHPQCLPGATIAPRPASTAEATQTKGKRLDYPHYNPNSDHRPLADDELEALDELLSILPGAGAMNVEILDGYLTALLVAPRPLIELPGADWLPVVWGGDDAAGGAAPFASQKQRKRVTMLVLRHLHDIDTRLRQSPKDWQPVFSVASLDALGLADTAAGDDEEEPISDDLADAQDWCAGFLQAVELDPEGWGALFDDPVLGPALLPIAVLGSDSVLGDTGDDKADVEPNHDPLADPIEVDRLSRAAAEVVLVLHQRRLG